MAMIKFATTCEVIASPGTYCLKESPQYTSWPSCRECLAEACPEHQAPGTLKENDGVETVICVNCAADEHA
jgi:hypothetical protein